MANNNSKNKKNNKKNNTKKVDTTKNVNNNKKVVNNTKEVNVKKEIRVEEINEEKVVTDVKKEKRTFKLTSKQRDFVLVLLVVVLLVIAFVLTGSKVPKLDIELPIALEGEAGFTEITYAEYEEKLNTEAPFVVVIVRDGCGYCDDYKPVLANVATEYSLPIYYINLSNLTNDEYTSLSSSNIYLKKEQWGTPTTLFMYGSTVVDSIGGYVDEETFKEFAKENFVVTENE